MHNHYIINGRVEFHPATSSLKVLDNPELVVELNSPAGRCLLLLIKKQGEIVAQQEFMDEVWKKNGVQVTPNTYYQNISILRKGLKKTGFEEDIIVTIPRMGLTLASGTNIEQKSLQHDSGHEISSGAQDNATIVEAAPIEQNARLYTSQIPEQTSESGIAPFGGINQNSPPPRVLVNGKASPLMGFIKCKKTAAFLAGMLTVAVAILLYNSLTSWKKVDYFANHRLIYQKEGCSIYANDNIPANGLRKRVIAYGLRFENECKTYPFIYLDYYDITPRVSVIRCTKEIHQSNDCVSDYFKEE
ncbi:transcriptional regulator [Erwinia sp. HR93]|uniref:transcriptional regulator n=1 Tax=Erwinia sp. HR93 TaxID=3094840 RepID=UPI002ADEC6C4|nr:winged helix-turn-helix domain-containing protein [Erwinia sp. HR93]MEA1063485.1 winged helix-turn-helix domain-containing protein [Erwinia sp. HR93]